MGNTAGKGGALHLKLLVHRAEVHAQNGVCIAKVLVYVIDPQSAFVGKGK